MLSFIACSTSTDDSSTPENETTNTTSPSGKGTSTGENGTTLR